MPQEPISYRSLIFHRVAPRQSCQRCSNKELPHITISGPPRLSYNYDEMTNYNDGNRAFLQAFMGRSSMTFEDARPVLAAIRSISGTVFRLSP